MASIRPRRLHPLQRSPQLERLAQRAQGGELPPSLLVLGSEGSGKEFTAIELARAALCPTGHTGDDGADCTACRKVRRLAHPDLLYAFPAESSLSRDGYRELVDLRAENPLRRLPQPSSAIIAVGDPNDPSPGSVRAIRRFVGGKPFEAAHRVVIIGDAHRMNRAAANALLKTLEEPPPAACLLLCTHQPHNLPSTVRSRCGRVHVPPLSPTELAQHLVAAFDLKGPEAMALASSSGGNARRAIDLLDPNSRQLSDWAESVLGWIHTNDLASLLRAAERIPKGQDPGGGKASKLTDGSLTASRDIASRVLEFLIDDSLVLERIAVGATVDPLHQGRLGPHAQGLTPGLAAARTQLLMEARDDLHRNVNVSLVLTHAFSQVAAAHAPREV